MRYSIANLLVMMTLCAAVVWCFSIDRTFGFVAVILLIGVVVAFVSREKYPHRNASIAGAGFIFACVFVWWSYEWINFVFIYDGSRPYWEDGLVVEGLIYPVIFCAMYGPVGAVLAFASALATTASLTLWPSRSATDE